MQREHLTHALELLILASLTANPKLYRILYPAMEVNKLVLNIVCYTVYIKYMNMY